MNIQIKSDFAELSSAEEIFNTILMNKGLVDQKDIDNFLHPEEPTLKYLISESSLSMDNLLGAKKMVLDAIASGEDILIFGDYDADGITSTAILWQTLSFLSHGSKARIMPFIPQRGRHGYGLTQAAIDDIESGYAFKDTSRPDFRPTLVITVDNGIVAVDEVAILKQKGIKVIITDHHQAGDKLPDCDYLVHTTATSGAGISWIFSLFITEENNHISRLIDIATIGVVADQLPLTGLNRSIVTRGLRELSNSSNPGIVEMKKIAGIEGRQVSSYDINFRLAPRINAVGRIGSALDALRLLCTRDKSMAVEIASTLDTLNSDRQNLTDSAVQVALKKSIEHKLLVVASRDFHEGVIGLVAGRLAEIHHRPALVISIGENSAKGSARSIPGVNITDIMRSQKQYLLSVGGHEQAGGFSLKPTDIEAFTDAISRYADEHIDDKFLVKLTHIEGYLELKQITKTLAKYISSLEPFGMGNHKPKFALKDVRVLEDRKIGRDGSHRKLVIESEGTTRDVIWFNGDARHPMTSIKQMLFTIELNVWNGKESVQLSANYVEPN